MNDAKLDALKALAHAPFVLTCAVLIVAAVWLAWQHERRANPYLSPWAEREPGDLS